MGKTVLISLVSNRVHHLEEADESLLVQVKKLRRIPLGWQVKNGSLTSPWGALGTAKRQGGQKDHPFLVCSKTGRPAFLSDSPEVSMKLVNTYHEKKPIIGTYSNPESYKGGPADKMALFRLTVSNTGQKPVTLHALRQHQGKILWNESLAIVYLGPAREGMVHVKRGAVLRLDGPKRSGLIRGAKGLPDGTEAVVLAAGQSLSTVLDAREFGLNFETKLDAQHFHFLVGLGSLSAVDTYNIHLR